MLLDSHPWPLSELDPDELLGVLSLPPKLREKRIAAIRADILSGAHAKRKRQQEARDQGA